ncbi:MAG: MFS transporter [Vicinamibacterales bacterium]
MPGSALVLDRLGARPAARRANVRWALAGLSLAALLPSLATSSVNATLPQLAQAFHTSFQGTQWIVLAYLLAVTGLSASAGRVGDLAGRRPTLLAGLGIFAVASMLCAGSATLAGVLAARVLQGVGAALVMALAVALVNDAVPEQATGRAMGLLGTTSAIGTALGPALGGVLAAHFGWRAIFIVNVPVAVLAAGLVSRHVPAKRVTAESGGARLDVAGTAALVMTLVPCALALTAGLRQPGLHTIGLLGLGSAGLVAFVHTQRASAAPLVPLALFRNRRTTAGLLSTAIVSAVMMGTLIVGPFYLSVALGLPPALAGLVLSIGPAVAAIGGVPAGWLVDRHGPGGVAVAGLAVTGCGACVLALAPGQGGLLPYVGPLVLMTAGYAAFQAANNTDLMRQADAGRRGLMAGLLGLSRNLGLITGAAVLGSVFRAVSAVDSTAASAGAVTSGMRITFAVTAALALTAVGVTASAVRPRTNAAPR